jgi:thiosulfate reductase cytochrome b subunit
MPVVAKLDELGKPAWIALMILGFFVYWPLGLFVLAFMIWSGLLIYWANGVYRIGVGDVTLVRFFPAWFYSLFGIDHRLAEGMSWHFLFMWLFAINGVAYVLYTVVSGEWRHLAPHRHDLRDAMHVTLHELGLSRREPPPHEKYNAAQRLAYTMIVLMGAGSLVTGLAIYKPVQLSWLTAALGGYGAARVEHFALTAGYVLFFVVHIVQVVRAGWNNFRSMVMGDEVTTTEERHG